MSRRPKRPNPPIRQIVREEDLPLLCTTADAGLLLRCTPEQVQRKAIAGDLPGKKEDNHWLFRRSDLLAYVDALFTPGEGGAAS